MPAEFTKYGYPTIDAADNWVPSRDPLVEGYAQPPERGVVSGLASGGRQVDYQVANATNRYVHHFRVTSWSDVTAFRVFEAAVMGRQFQMKDATTGGVAINVKFAPKWPGITPEPAPGVGEWDFVVELRRQIA